MPLWTSAERGARWEDSTACSCKTCLKWVVSRPACAGWNGQEAEGEDVSLPWSGLCQRVGYRGKPRPWASLAENPNDICGWSAIYVARMGRRRLRPPCQWHGSNRFLAQLRIRRAERTVAGRCPETRKEPIIPYSLLLQGRVQVAWRLDRMPWRRSAREGSWQHKRGHF